MDLTERREERRFAFLPTKIDGEWVWLKPFTAVEECDPVETWPAKMWVTVRRTRLLSLLLLGACVHRLSSEMQSWVGKDESALVSELGVPHRTADLPNGQKVLTWVRSWNSSQPRELVVMVDCVRSFTVANAKVVGWSANGCPSIVQGR